MLLLESPVAVRTHKLANVRMDLEVLLQIRLSVEMLRDRERVDNNEWTSYKTPVSTLKWLCMSCSPHTV